MLRLTERFDAPGVALESLRVDPARSERGARRCSSRSCATALEAAAANIRAVAEAQIGEPSARSSCPPGQTRDAARGPGRRRRHLRARAAAPPIPRRVLMCAIPAQVAGVERIALASPPGPDGRLHPLVLAAAALCGVDEIYAMGGAQAIFALAYGTETIAPVDVIAGPGNAWVREAKRAVYGTVGIDSLAGPSELMLIAGHDTDPEWAALDLCAQAEHGAGQPAGRRRGRGARARRDRRGDRGRRRLAAERRRRAAGAGPGARHRGGDRARQRLRPRAPRAAGGPTRRCWPTGSAPPAASSSAATARPPSATTSPAPTTCCRPAAPGASPARSGPAPSAAGSPTSRSDGGRGGAGAARRRPRPRRGLPRPRRVSDD